MENLKYQPLEIIRAPRPVSRIDYVTTVCSGKRVLDLGCWDETALFKIDTPYWLHGAVTKVAESVIGIDNSASLTNYGIELDNSKILKGSVTDRHMISGFDIDIIVASELIEHLANTLEFFLMLKEIYPGKRFLCTTPNATNLTNIILGAFRRESTHQDHLSVYSYKTLNTLCKRVNVTSYEIIPYYAKYSEMIIKAKPWNKWFLIFAEKSINFSEFLFPLWSSGYILDVIL